MDFNLPDPLILIPVTIAMSLAPVIAIMVTSYAKLVVVFSILRNALGLQQTPPNMVMNGLALILTWHIMWPVGNAVVDSIQAVDKSTTTELATRVINAGKEPLKQFLTTHAAGREKTFFFDISKKQADAANKSSIEQGLPPKVKPPAIEDFVILVPAFLITELTSAFLIGFLIFLPFIVVDLIIANILMAMGMQMLSPTVISLPVKLLLFVLVDGWSRLTHALILSYGTA